MVPLIRLVQIGSVTEHYIVSSRDTTALSGSSSRKTFGSGILDRLTARPVMIGGAVLMVVGVALVLPVGSLAARIALWALIGFGFSLTKHPSAGLSTARRARPIGVLGLSAVLRIWPVQDLTDLPHAPADLPRAPPPHLTEHG